MRISKVVDVCNRRHHIGICTDNLKDCTEEEIEDELVPILVQSGYVQQLCGKVELAMDLYTSALKSK